jgi:hypothetical protein
VGEDTCTYKLFINMIHFSLPYVIKVHKVDGNMQVQNCLKMFFSNARKKFKVTRNVFKHIILNKRKKFKMNKNNVILGKMELKPCNWGKKALN